MTTVSIPDWMGNGVLPPIDAINPTSAQRSPYRVSLTDLMLRFATSDPRRKVLDGLLRFRAALHQAGFVEGLQWLDGSFLEDIETIEGRCPNDIDVVTYYRLAEGQTQQAVFDRNPEIFDHAGTKAKYRVDAYFVSLDSGPEPLIGQSAYWYSVWAHRRDWTWKGYLEIDLASHADEDARAQLDSNGVSP